MLASVDSKRLTETLSPLDATLMKNWGEGWLLLLTRNPTKDSCPEEHRDEGSLFNSHQVNLARPSLATRNLSDRQLTMGGKTIFQNSGAGDRNSTGRSEPS